MQWNSVRPVWLPVLWWARSHKGRFAFRLAGWRGPNSVVNIDQSSGSHSRHLPLNHSTICARTGLKWKQFPAAVTPSGRGACWLLACPLKCFSRNTGSQVPSWLDSPACALSIKPLIITSLSRTLSFSPSMLKGPSKYLIVPVLCFISQPTLAKCLDARAGFNAGVNFSQVYQIRPGHQNFEVIINLLKLMAPWVLSLCLFG